VRLKMEKPRIYVRGHLLENVSYDKSYRARQGHAGWLIITDDSGKTIHLSKTMQKLFLVLEQE